MKIVLASASPRRREILSMVCPSFDIRISNADENYDGEMDIHAWIQAVAAKKALGVPMNEDEVIIGCDTIVTRRGKIFGKPKTRDEAIEMLRTLSGKHHTVVSAICIRTKDRITTEYERTIVRMRDITDEEIEKYIDTCEPYDKAGAYGIQEMAGAFVQRINGDFYNIVGLPLSRLCTMFKRVTGESLI